MMMIVDLSAANEDFMAIVDKIQDLAKEIGVDIKLQNQDIFDNMHRI